MSDFVKRSELWTKKSKTGVDELFSDGDVLIAEAAKYFKQCDESPLPKAELVSYQGDSTVEYIPLGRPYTMDGLCHFLGVSGSYLRMRRLRIRERVDKKTATPSEIGVLDAIERIEQFIRSQQLEGAMVGLLKEGIVARINGLHDHTAISGSGSNPINITIGDQATADALKAIEEQI